MTIENSEDANYDRILRVLETPVKSIIGLGRLSSGKKIQKLRLTPSKAFECINLNSETPRRSTALRRQNHKMTNCVRGNYRNYSEEIKRQAIELFEQTGDLKFVSQKLKVPSKNIDRWVKNGIARKKGGELISGQKTELS